MHHSSGGKVEVHFDGHADGYLVSFPASSVSGYIMFEEGESHPDGFRFEIDKFNTHPIIQN